MPLRYYQEEAVQSIFDYFISGKTGNPVIAAPTGTGKSLIIAELIHRTFQNWPNQRFLMLTHVKELLVQNSNKLKAIWPTAPVGIYSAGLGEKTTMLPIIFGGIASVNSNPEQFGHIDIVIVDECHMISTNESSMYRKVIEKLKVKNPYLKVIGLSATPFRMGQGMITDGGLFTDIAYSASSLQGFNRLVAEGYIAPLIPKRTSLQLNVESVKIVNGDYQNKELQAAVDVDAITYAAIKEMIEYGYERHCGLVFASGIEHCEHVTSAIQSFGESATCVHSKMASKERDRRIAEFKQGVHKYIVSNGILTTGFDHPPIDIIGFLRPTLSVALWVQSLGRGTRPYSWLIEDQYISGYNYVKDNCLVLDFAGNTRRLGPINDPVLPRKKGQKTGDAPIRICDKCGVYNHASARFCCACGAVFEFRNKLFDEASTEELIKSDMPIIELFNITRVIYHKHTKLGSPNMLQVTYYSGLRSFKKFICIEHTGFSGTKAREWWARCSEETFPESVDKALAMAGNLKTPKRISVHTNKQYPEVLNYEY